MIPDEAVEALASVLAQEALVEADMGGYGWDAETDSPEQFMPRSRERVREYLKAAAPHLMAAAWEEGELAGYTNAGAEQWGYDQKFNPYRKPTDARG